MKTTFYLNGKKTSRKALTEKIGADRLKRYIEEAKEAFFADPLTQNSFWLGGKDTLTIQVNPETARAFGAHDCDSHFSCALSIHFASLAKWADNLVFGHF